mgnify:CR=1 FL=1
MTTPEIKEAVEFEDIFLQDKIERRAYEQREKAIRDYYSYMSVFRYSEGLQQGLYQQAIQTAKNMLKDKVGIKIISKYTNLSIDEVEELKTKLDM